MQITTFGEIMMRLTTPRHQRFRQATHLEVAYGGGESNVAVSLANYGHEVRYVSKLPDNDLGDCAVRSLRASGIDTSCLLRGGKRLGTYYLETGAAHRASKVIYDREDSALATIGPGEVDWDKAFEGTDWYHWSGITPAVSASAAAVCREACEAAAARGITISVDLNHRSKLWQYGKTPAQVMPELVEHCDVIVGGSFEAQLYFGLEIEDPGNFEATARILHGRFPKARRIAGTFRDSISASHNSYAGRLWDGELYKTPTYEITHIVDRVGTGDSFMGGLIHGLLTRPDDPAYALNFATAASALKHTIPGDVNMVTAEEVVSLMEGDGSVRVRR